MELTANDNDVWTKYAKYYIEDIDERINDTELSKIADIIDDIKNELLIENILLTQYTSLSALQSLILEKSKFRLSEGNFLNDPSEGKVFFNYLEYKPNKNNFCFESFSPKPFIGSFVTDDKCDDLNMWRFYGKENGVEAKGCSITIRAQEFIKAIHKALAKENEFIKYESDINFYRIAYVEATKFNICTQNLDRNLDSKLENLKEQVTKYAETKTDRTSLENRLNSIAFLFKSDAYKHENEVRMIIKGVEFKKQYMTNLIPPRIYIELVPIRDIVEQIILGPKVDNVNEWAATFHYSYENNTPKILISQLPYR